MTPLQWQQVKDVFLAAIRQPPDRRLQFLRDRCDGQTEVLDEIQAMLAQHTEPPTDDGDATTASDATSAAMFGAAAEIPAELAELARHLPHLEIQSRLGEGGMGVVYLARQLALDRMVAVKVLPSDAGRNPAFAERFTREARALARLNHPNIVAIYEFGQAAGRYFLTMEYVDGINLRQMEKNERLSPRQALAIVPQICDALQYAHDQGIVHRDIKPENILLDRQGRVKIADFGLAKLRAAAPTDPALTQPEQVMGTPHYMAPEQVERPLSVDHRADIYSLGVVFYEMLTGELPMGRFAPPSQKAAVDARVDTVVLRSLEKDPQDRYQAVSEVHNDLESVRRGAEVPDYTRAPVPPWWKRARRLLLRVVARAAIPAITIGLLSQLWLGVWLPWHLNDLTFGLVPVAGPVNFFDGFEPLIHPITKIYYGAMLAFGLGLLASTLRRSWRSYSRIVCGLALLAAAIAAPTYRLMANPLVLHREKACTGYVQYDRANRLLVGKNDGVIEICDPVGRESGANISANVTGEHPGLAKSESLEANNVCVSPTRDRLLVRRSDLVLELIDPVHNRLIKSLSHRPSGDRFNARMAAVFSPDGTRFAAVVSSSGGYPTIEEWRRDSGLGLQIFASADGSPIAREEKDHLLSAYWQAIDWSGDLIAITDAELKHRRGTLLYDIRKHAVRFFLDCPEASGLSAKFSPDAGILAVGCATGAVILWDTKTGKLMRTLTAATNWVVCLDFSPDGRLLACGEGDNAVRLWEIASARQLRHFGMDELNPRFTNYTYSVSFDRTGKLLACGGEHGDLVIWKVP